MFLHYKYSTIRAYLNGKYEAGDTQTDVYTNKGFLQTAFTSQAQSLIADTEMKAMQNQINAHFLYNVLETIRMQAVLADQDDIWLPGKVKQMVEALQNSALAIHDAYLLQERCEGVFERGDSLSEIRPFAKGLFKNWLKNRYTGCCMALRCELLDKALPFPKKLPMHDQWLGMIAEKFFDVAYVDSPLISYRQHKKNATHIAGGGAGVIQKLKWRLDLLRAFWSRR